MSRPPDGPTLSIEAARQLDDEFFGSDPHAYFRSRIAMLTDPEPSPGSGPKLRDDVLAAVGLTAADQPLMVDPRAHPPELRHLRTASERILEPTSVGAASCTLLASVRPRMIRRPTGF